MYLSAPGMGVLSFAEISNVIDWSLIIRARKLPKKSRANCIDAFQISFPRSTCCDIVLVEMFTNDI